VIIAAEVNTAKQRKQEQEKEAKRSCDWGSLDHRVDFHKITIPAVTPRRPILIIKGDRSFGA
jgi:hypothetical protein